MCMAFPWVALYVARPVELLVCPHLEVPKSPIWNSKTSANGARCIAGEKPGEEWRVLLKVRQTNQQYEYYNHDTQHPLQVLVTCPI